MTAPAPPAPPSRRRAVRDGTGAGRATAARRRRSSWRASSACPRAPCRRGPGASSATCWPSPRPSPPPTGRPPWRCCCRTATASSCGPPRRGCGPGSRRCDRPARTSPCRRRRPRCPDRVPPPTAAPWPSGAPGGRRGRRGRASPGWRSRSPPPPPPSAPAACPRRWPDAASSPWSARRGVDLDEVAVLLRAAARARAPAPPGTAEALRLAASLEPSYPAATSRWTPEVTR